MNRKYELKERARRQAQTRQRIVEAAADLHTSVGPARTTISGIAERAGVERHTVYAHFPDELHALPGLLQHWAAKHPLPDIATLAEIDDPVRRLRRLSARSTRGTTRSRPIWRCSFATRPSSPSGDHRPETSQLATLADAVSLGWPRRKSVRAAIGHALDFETWRSLVRRQGLSRAQAVDAMARLVASV